ncbi:hypothetical protein FQN60_005621 [Etheostoma spectabile]|uniref:Uncharacterized protein n=1 Tax=Etheostoma spectabile TaxID=54343 RepID=A0A5J5CHS9_9PERO|nr:hypothetical protein FQN60_005621 [Etheostoma spectabile]
MVTHPAHAFHAHVPASCRRGGVRGRPFYKISRGSARH